MTEREVVDLWRQTKEVNAFAQEVMRACRRELAEQFEARYEASQQKDVHWLAAANHIRSLNSEQLFDDWPGGFK
jgi:uncharacterized protein (DUF924 family)